MIGINTTFSYFKTFIYSAIPTLNLRFVKELFRSLAYCGSKPFCKQVEIYSNKEVNQWHQFLQENEERMIQPQERRELLKQNPETEAYRYSNPDDTWFQVTFDENHCVIFDEASTVYRNCKEVDTLARPLIRKSMEKMARELNLSAGTHMMGMSILQHHQISKTNGMDWHYDASSYTMVVLLDDASRWSGGEFLFRWAHTLFHQVFQPKLGHAVLFTNEGTQHKVNPLQAHEGSIDRTIFSLHLKIEEPSHV